MATAAVKKETKPKASKGRYIESRGGRKTAVARVRLTPDLTGIIVNGKPIATYFPMPKHRMAVESPITLIGGFDLVGGKGVSVWVKGGGVTGQAEAARHGLARVLSTLDPSWKLRLKAAGFLTRDPRAVERKKYGLKKARRAPQWSKR